jgi:hypothetical protein
LIGVDVLAGEIIVVVAAAQAVLIGDLLELDDCAFGIL